MRAAPGVLWLALLLALAAGFAPPRLPMQFRSRDAELDALLMRVLAEPSAAAALEPRLDARLRRLGPPPADCVAVREAVSRAFLVAEHARDRAAMLGCVALLRTLRRRAPAPEDLRQIAAMLVRASDADGAAAAMEQLALLQPRSAETLGELGAAYESAARWPEAVDAFRREALLRVDRNASAVACAAAWAVQDDLLAEPAAEVLLVWRSEAPPAWSDTHFAPSQRAWATERMLAHAQVDLGAAAAAARARWAWHERDAVVAALPDALLLHPRTAMLSAGCVLFSRGEEPMEGWRAQATMFPLPGDVLWGMDAATRGALDTALVLDEHPVALAVTAFAWNNFYHWVVDVAARLVVFAEQVLPREPDARALVPMWTRDPAVAKRHVDETAAMLGIEPWRLMALWPDQPLLHIRRALSIEWRRRGEPECPALLRAPPSARRQCWRRWPADLHLNSVYTPPVDVLRALRRRAGGGAFANWSRVDLVVATRGPHAELRAVTGERELVAALRRALPASAVVREFDAAGLSLAEQAAFFRGANVLVGAHGAGLVNAVHMPDGAVVVELPTREHASSRYFQDVATAMRQQHWIVPGVAVEKAAAFRLGAEEVEMVVETVMSAVGVL